SDFSNGVTASTTQSRMRRVSCPELSRFTWTARPNTWANKTATRMLTFRWRLRRLSILQFPVLGSQFPVVDQVEPERVIITDAFCSRPGFYGRGRPQLHYSIEIFLSSLKSLSILPVPSTTLHILSSAIDTGNPVSSRMRLSRFFNNAPPPVRTMPRSLISADNSGGVLARATRIAFM